MTRSSAAASAALSLLLLAACSDGSPVEPTTAASRTATTLTPAVVDGTDFSGVETPTDLLDPGTAVFTDDRIVVHGTKVATWVAATDARVTGPGVVTANGVISTEDGSGPVWGDFTIEAGGGTWTGTWRGHRAPTGPTWTADVDWRMRGEGGAIDKLQAAGTNTITSFTLVPGAFVSVMQGTIW